MPPRSYESGEREARRASTAADVRHMLTYRGGRSRDRGVAERRQHVIEPHLVGNPTLAALAVPIGDLTGVLFRHAISAIENHY